MSSMNSFTQAGRSSGSVHHSLLLAPATPDTSIFTFTSFNPNILNCAVYGPRSERCFTITTGHGSTVFRSEEGKHVAFIDWQLPPSVEIRGMVPYQPISSWMRLSPDQGSRNIQFGGMRYRWVPHDSYICLYTNDQTPRLLARVSRARDCVILEMQISAIWAGLSEVVIVATALLQCGRNID